MNSLHARERGQALILVVFAIVGLIGLTGLAIDGGGAYSDRRHAQNAADTAVMAAALSRVRHANDADQVAAWNTSQQAAYDIAGTNGYSNSDPSKVVHVYRCDDVASSCSLPAGETKPENYIQVTIQSTIRTYFAPVLGIRTLTNYVQAVAKAVPPVAMTWYNGNALVATMPGCKPNGWPDNALVLAGGSQTTVFGISGVYINADCDSTDSFTASNGTSLVSPSICNRGTSDISSANVNPPPEDNCSTAYDFSTYTLPPVGDDSCKKADGTWKNGSAQKIGGNWYTSPGRYTGTFPPVSGSGGKIYLASGVYCLYDSPNAMTLTGSNWELTTDLNNNGNTADYGSEGVLFYVPNGGVTVNTTMHLSAMEDAARAGALKGYLFYLPPANTSTISLAGNGNSTIQGTILAPSARVTLSGGSSADSLSLESQIIGFSVGLSGQGTLNITYNQSLNGETWTQPSLQPYNNK